MKRIRMAFAFLLALGGAAMAADPVQPPRAPRPATAQQAKAQADAQAQTGQVIESKIVGSEVYRGMLDDCQRTDLDARMTLGRQAFELMGQVENVKAQLESVKAELKVYQDAEAKANADKAEAAKEAVKPTDK